MSAVKAAERGRASLSLSVTMGEVLTVGFFMRINAFRGVSHADVYAALDEFWTRHGRRIALESDQKADTFELYEQLDDWTVLDWTRGWEWKLRRQAQLYVSEKLGCAGILVFVHDGDYWGYELFDRGTAVDWFVQYQDQDGWFSPEDVSGKPEAVVAAFPDLALDQADVAPYLVQRPEFPDDEEHDDAQWAADEFWDVRARPDDKTTRGDSFAVMDFLDLLDIPLEHPSKRMRWLPPRWRRFRVEPPPVNED
jgi:hypothetical protein